MTMDRPFPTGDQDSTVPQGNRTPDLLITRRPYHAFYGVYQRQQLQFSHLWVHQRHR